MWNGLTGGVFIWAVPFALSCCVIIPDENGQMVRTLDEHHFRTLMVVSAGVACFFASSKCRPASLREGVRLAVTFLVVNWLLDLLVLVPLMVTADGEELSRATWAMKVPVWFREIGAGYLGGVWVPIIAGKGFEEGKREENDGKNE
jgi:hypothetical protein